jgi:hypothetical protein
LNEDLTVKASYLVDEVSKWVDNTDASGKQQYIACLERMLDNAEPSLRMAAIKNLAALNSVHSIEAIRRHVTLLPQLTVNGISEQTGDDSANVRQAALQALMQLHDLELPVLLNELEKNETDFSVRPTLHDLRTLSSQQGSVSTAPERIFSDEQKDLEAFYQDTKKMTKFLSTGFSRLLEPPTYSWLSAWGRGDANEIEMREESDQWDKLSELASGILSDGQTDLSSRSDQAKIVLFAIIQGKLSPSKENNENLAQRDWQVQEKAAHALAKACQTGTFDRVLSVALVENCLAHPDNCSPQSHSELLAVWKKLCAERLPNGQNVIPRERANRNYDDYKPELHADSRWSQMVIKDMTTKLFELNCSPYWLSPTNVVPGQTLLTSIEQLAPSVRLAVSQQYRQQHNISICDHVAVRFGRNAGLYRKMKALLD